MNSRLTAYKFPLSLFILVVGMLLLVMHIQAQPMTGGKETAVASSSELLCRFGVNALENPTLTNLPSLRAGWYMNFTAQNNPPRPSGMEYMQTIRIKPNLSSPGYTYKPTGITLTNIITQNLGAKWLISNEPDSPYQDNLTPDIYARAYNELYHLIKSQDATAQIIVGSIVQATPVRLLYLDRVLSSYYDQFNTPLPTDGWSIHNYILNEVSCDYDNTNCWGAVIPPGINWGFGEVWGLKDTDRIDIFVDRITRFRQWMADRGYTGQPVYLTEYGVLMPEDFFDEDGNNFPPSRVNTFMASTFDYMLTATDPQLGNPNDGFKLVQQWSWFSTTDETYNGTLFDKSNFLPTEMGDFYANYTSGITTEVDFYPSLITTAPPIPYSQGQLVTVTLRTVIANSGNLTKEITATVQFYDGAPQAGGNQIGTDQGVKLAGCGDHDVVDILWTNIDPGVHNVYVQVTPPDSITETNTTNNQMYGQILVGTNQIFLPIISRSLSLN